VIWIARHARRLDFDDPSWAARAERPHDPPLSPAGEREAQALARRLEPEPIAHLFSSPFLRCIQTAHAVATRLGLAIRVEPGLSEWLNRDWFPSFPDVLPLAELARRAPEIDDSYAARGSARYGESGEEALLRSARVARRLASEFPGDLLLVGHGASVIGAVSGLLGELGSAGVRESLRELPYASLVQLVERGATWTLGRCADTEHLRELRDRRG